jgi:hypothetical protein
MNVQFISICLKQEVFSHLVSGNYNLDINWKS